MSDGKKARPAVSEKGAAKKQAREARLALALRRNLKRRRRPAEKAAAKARPQDAPKAP